MEGEKTREDGEIGGKEKQKRKEMAGIYSRLSCMFRLESGRIYSALTAVFRFNALGLWRLVLLRLRMSLAHSDALSASNAHMCVQASQESVDVWEKFRNLKKKKATETE